MHCSKITNVLLLHVLALLWSSSSRVRATLRVVREEGARCPNPCAARRAAPGGCSPEHGSKGNCLAVLLLQVSSSSEDTVLVMVCLPRKGLSTGGFFCLLLVLHYPTHEDELDK